MTYKFSFFFKLIKKIGLSYLTLLSVFMLFRFFILFQFGNYNDLKNNKLDIIKAFYVGGKFDTSVITYALIPILLLAIMQSVFYRSSHDKYRYFSKISQVYLVFVSMILLVISIIDLFSSKDTDFFGENDYNTAGNTFGVITNYNNTLYYKWKDTINYKGLESTTLENSPNLHKLKRRMDAHETLTMLHFQNDVISQSQKK